MKHGPLGSRVKVRIVPLTLPVANRIVDRIHRHHAAIPGGFAWWACGAIVDSKIVGAAIAGRPTNRNNDDRQTVEVLRVATDGTPNAPSALLGACARCADAIGAWRIITYTLSTEAGASLRGAGWICEDANTGRSWWGHAGSRAAAVDREHFAVGKARWVKRFRAEPFCVEYDEIQPIEAATLFGSSPTGKEK